MAYGGVLPAHDAQAEDAKVQEEAPTDEGVPRMTAKVLEESCLSNRGYVAPELNEVLILHYKGFRKIEGLGAYTQVRSLFLDCNGIRKIENLEVMPLLVSLYLQSNCITAIENLEALTKLQYLNLSNNGITHVSGLASLHSLETINLAANKISSVEALEGLCERHSLKSVDVSCNYVEDGDAFVDFWGQNLPEVECLYLHHNTCSRSLKDYRRRLVSSLPKLRWIDERPVTASERVGCEAWAVGGKEAEAEAKRGHFQQEQDAKRQSLQNFRRVQQAAAERARAQREAQASRDAARSQAADAFRDTGALAEGWTTVPSRPAARQSSEVAEPARQQELHSKVEAFFKRPSAETAAEAVDSSASLEEPSGDGTSEMPAVAEAIPASDHVEELEGAEGLAPDPVAVAEDEPAPEAPFEWSNFRDKRLGRLVADFRYNFRKAAEALGQEFGGGVSEQECRRRYGELTRPSSAASGGAQPRPAPADRGRARDAPEPDAAAVREVNDWWMRRLAQAPRDAPSQLSKLLGGSGVGPEAASGAPAHGETEGEHLGGRVAAVPISPFAGLIGDDQPTPTPAPASARAAAVPAEELAAVDLTSRGAAGRPATAFAPPPRSVAVGGSSQSADLFQLD